MKSRIEFILLIIVLLIGLGLRLYGISDHPPGLYIDEISSGYNAYTILTTGVDEHGESFPLWFKAYGEYKMPVMIYGMSMAMAFFGKTEFAVRLPTMIAGVATLLGLFLLVKELLHITPKSNRISAMTHLPLVSTLVLATLPWHIHFSRAGFEATIALCFLVFGFWSALRGLRTKSTVMIGISVVLLVLTVYTYQAYRLMLPFMLVMIGVLSYWHFKYPVKKLMLPLIIGAILLIPAILFTLSESGSVRFSQISAFSEHSQKMPLEKVFLYPITYISNYVSFFSPSFLFNHGDGIGRHQMPDFGLLWMVQLPFLLIGAFLLTLPKNRVFKVILIGLVVIIPIPAALVLPSPHSLRVMPFVIPFSIMIALGILTTLKYIRPKTVVIVLLIGGIALFELSHYLHHYYRHYSTVNLMDWGGGYKDMVTKTRLYADRYDIIAVDSNLGFSDTYFNFYDDSLNPLVVDTTWKAPPGKKVLLIRPNYNEQSNHVIDRVHLPNLNNDIFAEFWSYD